MADSDPLGFNKASTILTAISTFLIFIVGWMFTLMVQDQQRIQDRQEKHAAQLAKLQVQVEVLEDWRIRTKTKMLPPPELRE